MIAAAEIRSDARDLAYVVGNLTADLTAVNGSVGTQGDVLPRLGDLHKEQIGSLFLIE